MSEPCTDHPNPPAEHPTWCDPGRCLVATVEGRPTPVVLEHVGAPVELTTSEGRFTVERAQEVDTRPAAVPVPGFARLTVERTGFDEDQLVIHVSASDALDLAALLQSIAGQIGGQR